MRNPGIGILIRCTIGLFMGMLLVPNSVWATDHYVRAGATGNGSGSDWTNACTGFTGSCAASSLVRGDTYYVAAGSYGYLDITSPDVGTEVITIKAATVADHGTSTGWSNGYAGQALFQTANNQTLLETDYITIDGQSRAGYGSGYNIKFRTTGTCNTCAALILGNPGASGGGSASNHDIVEYVEMQGSGSTVGEDKAAIVAVNGSYNQFLYDWFHNAGNDLLDAHTGAWTNLTVDHCFLDTNDMGGANTGKHSTGLNVTGDNLTVSNNWFRNIQSSDMIENAAGGHTDLSNWYIFGNVFYWDSGCSGCGIGDGEIGILVNGSSGTNLTGTLMIVNNTIAGVASPSYCSTGGGGACNAFPLYIDSGVVYNTATIDVENNLFWNTGNLSVIYGAYDYNSYYGGVDNTADIGAHSKVISGNPFVDSSTNDYQLAAHTDAGLTITTPAGVAIDPLGVSRSASGNWDRGAYEFAAGAVKVSPPLALTVTGVS